MQKHGVLVLVGVIFMVSACGKKSNEQLATTYFKMALIDLSEAADEAFGARQALADLDNALKHAQKPEYYALKGTVLFKLGQYQASEEALNCALSKTTDSALKTEIMNNLACLWAQMGKHEKAAVVWEQLKSDIFYKTPEVAMVNLGKLYVGQGELDKAERALHEAVSMAPSYLDAHFYRALVAKEQGNKALMAQECGTVLALEPLHHGAKHLMSVQAG